MVEYTEVEWKKILGGYNLWLFVNVVEKTGGLDLIVEQLIEDIEKEKKEDEYIQKKKEYKGRYGG